MSEKVTIREERQRDRVLDLIRALDLRYAWDVEIKRHQKRRTLSQNALYWKWVNEAAEHVSHHTGYEKEEVHELFKRKFLTPEIVTIGGETVEIYSTRSQSTKAMSEYMEAIDRFCASQLGILLPRPEDLHAR